MEIALSTKNKLRFVKGSFPRYLTDANKVELWDTCNIIVISWIMAYVSESIVKSIMFFGTASEIWSQLKICLL